MSEVSKNGNLNKQRVYSDTRQSSVTQQTQLADNTDSNVVVDPAQYVANNKAPQAVTTTLASTPATAATADAATDDIKTADNDNTADTGLDDCCDYIDDWSDFSKKMELLGDFVDLLDQGFDYFDVLAMAKRARKAKEAKEKEEDEKRLIFGSVMGDSPCTNEVSALKSKYGMRCCCVTCDPDDPLNKYGDIDARRPLNKDESMADFEYINEAYTMEYNIDGLPKDTDFLTGLRNAEAIKRYEQLRFRRLLKLEEQDKKNEDSN